MLVLSQSDVHRLLTMPKCVELMRGTLSALARGEATLPLRTVFAIPDGAFAVMPAALSNPSTVGAKLITVLPKNHGTQYDSHQGAVLLFDTGNGSLLSVMDASSITQIRTAAASGVATDALARQSATSLGILGAGVQGQSHLEAMCAVRPLKSAKIWSRNRDSAESVPSRTNVSSSSAFASSRKCSSWRSTATWLSGSSTRSMSSTKPSSSSGNSSTRNPIMTPPLCTWPTPASPTRRPDLRPNSGRTGWGDRTDRLIGVPTKPADETPLALTRREITPAALRSVLWRYPAMTLGVIARIHWEAWRTYRKGAAFNPNPETLRRQRAKAEGRTLSPRPQTTGVPA